MGATMVVAFAFLHLLAGDVPLHPDTAEDLLMARDCAVLGACRTVGPPASVRGLFHGTLWIRLLAVIALLGGGVATAQLVVHALQAVAVGVLQLAVRRWVWVGGATVTAALTLAILALFGDGVKLTTVSVMPLPLVLATVSLLGLVAEGRTGLAALAGVWLGVLIDCHPVAWALVPTLVFLCGTLARRPVGATATAVGALIATTAASSWMAWRHNVATGDHPLRPVLLVAAAVAAGVAARLTRARLRRLGHRGRLGVLVGALVVPVVAGNVWVVAYLGRGFELRFIYPLLPALATLAACGLTALVRHFPRSDGRTVVARAPRMWRSSAAVSAGVLLVAAGASAMVSRSTGPGPWTFDDLERVSARVTATGLRYGDLPLGLQGGACWKLVAGLGVFAPPPRESLAPSRRALLLLRANPGSAATLRLPGLERLRLRGGRVALLRPLDSWLDRRGVEVCYRPLAGAGGAQSCTRLKPDPTADRGVFRFARRAYPAVHNLEFQGPHLARYSIGVAPLVDDRARTITVIDPAPAACAWGIESAPGRPAGAPRVRSVRLQMRVGDRGRLVLTKRFGGRECGGGHASPDRRFPPCLVETRAGEEGLRALAVAEGAP